jgi:ATP-binding protein involved in chromosome partitioning
MFKSKTSQIVELLEKFVDPIVQQPWKNLKVVAKVTQTAGQFLIEVVLPYPVALYQQQLEALVQEYLSPFVTEKTAVQFSWKINAHASVPGIELIPGVKNIIAVASGKGGVGKSTTAVNLALALALQGAQVGLLDADIHGPNQPQMLGFQEKLMPENGSLMQAAKVHGIQSMSMGYLIDVNTPMVWRGPMVSSALLQLAKSTQWENLDYLIIDLPPGTGDIQLTLSQKIPVTASVIVTTPQDVALLDARKGIEMFNKVNIPVLGIIENMSHYQCGNCGHVDAIFGNAGGRHLADAYEVELLAQLPLFLEIRECADQGIPLVKANPEHIAAQHYHTAALKIAGKLALRARNMSSKFPKIVIE